MALLEYQSIHLGTEEPTATSSLRLQARTTSLLGARLMGHPLIRIAPSHSMELLRDLLPLNQL